MKRIDNFKKPWAVLVSAVLSIVSPEKMVCSYIELYLHCYLGHPLQWSIFPLSYPSYSVLLNWCLLHPKPEEYALCSSSQSPTSTFSLQWCPFGACAPHSSYTCGCWSRSRGPRSLALTTYSTVTLPSVCVFRFYQHVWCFICRFSWQHRPCMLLAWLCPLPVSSVHPDVSVRPVTGSSSLVNVNPLQPHSYSLCSCLGLSS